MESSLPTLTPQEIRVLGCLIEKSRTTPDYYPLTLNGLVTACNQKTSRSPVVNYSEGTVIEALDALRKKGLTGTVVGGGSRVTKYKHNMQLKYSIGIDDLAILCLLMLRGPLTVGEINSNSGRLYNFDSLDEVNELLVKLSENNPAFVQQIARKPGQKEGRFIQLFSKYKEEEYGVDSEDSIPGNTSYQSLESRVESLENELTELKNAFEKLFKELHG